MTAIPAALTALVDAFTGAAPVLLKVFDGPVLDPPPDFLSVGWDGGASEEAVTAVEAISDYGLAADLETFDVVCWLSVQRGSGTPTDVRVALYAYLATLKAAVKADPQLGGAVLLARIDQHVYSQWLPSEGAGGRIRFNVHAQASAP